MGPCFVSQSDPLFVSHNCCAIRVTIIRLMMPEVLAGENKYCVEEEDGTKTYCDALIGCGLKKLPKVLHLQVGCWLLLHLRPSSVLHCL